MLLCDFEGSRLKRWWVRWARERGAPFGNDLEARPTAGQVCVVACDLRGYRAFFANQALDVAAYFLIVERSSLAALERLNVDEFATLDSSDEELSIRLDRLMARCATRPDPVRRVSGEQVRAGNLVLNPTSRTVHIGGRRVTIRRAEFNLLEYLVTHRERVVPSQELQYWVLKTSGDGGSVRTHLWELRRKLRAAGCEDAVTTVRGVGYRWDGAIGAFHS